MQANVSNKTGNQTSAGFMAWLQREIRIIGPFVMLVLLAAIFSLSVPGFASVANAVNIVVQSSFLLILAIGITMVLLLAEIDLSFANVASVIGVAFIFLVGKGVGWPLSLVAALLAGIAIGWVNGFVIARIGVPSFVATLGMLEIAGGGAIFIAQGQPLFTIPNIVSFVANGRIWGIPFIIVFALLCLIVSHLVLTQTRFGRYVYMVGGNREAAFLAGVNVRFITITVLIVAAFMASLYGILETGRLGSAQAGSYTNVLIDGLAAVVIGGTSLFGGEGGVINTALGVVFLIMLSNGLDMLTSLNIYLKPAITGAILLLSLIFNVYMQRMSQVHR